MDKQIAVLRKEVDQIDNNIIKLLRKRFLITKYIGRMKKAANLGIVDQKRWDELLTKNLRKAEKLGLPETLIRKIYQLIHQYSVKLQKES